MALASAVQNALRPTQRITWTDDNGTALDLTGATITGKIRNETTKVVRSIAGSLPIVTAASGIFDWIYAAGDVVDAGSFEVQFTASYGSPPSPARNIVTKWHVYEALV